MLFCYLYSTPVRFRGHCEIADQYWGDRTFTAHDPDGYVLTFARTVKQVSVEEILEAMKQQQ